MVLVLTSKLNCFIIQTWISFALEWLVDTVLYDEKERKGGKGKRRGCEVEFSQ